MEAASFCGVAQRSRKRYSGQQEQAPKNKYNLHKITIKFGNF